MVEADSLVDTWFVSRRAEIPTQYSQEPMLEPFPLHPTPNQISFLP